ncbi:MAG TPA: hypothetical protein VLA46_11480, partial [Saprospiraceae bacterium]|nr:hypothetical protein [Saprospiraceae bacterium]
MVQTQTNDETLFRSWQQRNVSKSFVQAELSNQGYSTEEISSMLEEYTRYRIARRNTMGWCMMGLGGFLGLVSCVLTMLDPLPDFRGLFMYGFTSIAVIMAFYGCYL